MTRASTPPSAPPTIVVWDVGRVLVEWDLGLIYRQAIPDAAQRARFVAEVVSEEWHGQHDAGGPGQQQNPIDAREQRIRTEALYLSDIAVQTRHQVTDRTTPIEFRGKREQPPVHLLSQREENARRGPHVNPACEHPNADGECGNSNDRCAQQHQCPSITTHQSPIDDQLGQIGQ